MRFVFFTLALCLAACERPIPESAYQSSPPPLVDETVTPKAERVENNIEPIISKNEITENDIRILALGDSRVDGNQPDYESYRYELWKLLIGDGWNVDMVGPITDDGSYLPHLGQTFDPDHAGVGGFKTTHVLDNLDRVMEDASDLDYVLLCIGGNDLILMPVPVDNIAASVRPIHENIATIIRRLQRANPDVTILVEQIAPGRPINMTDVLPDLFREFNAGIPHLADQLSTSRSQVVAVDMRVGWSETYLADMIHYNEAGARFVATRYFETLRDLK